MSSLRTFALGLCTVALLGCETPTSPTSQLLRVTSDGAALTLKNPNAWPMFYVAINPNALIAANYALCVAPTCPTVPAHGSLRVPYAQILGYSEGQTEIQVWQWRIRQNAGGDYEMIDRRTVQVKL